MLERQLLLTRRHFFGRGGVGSRPWRRCWGATVPRRRNERETAGVGVPHFRRGRSGSFPSSSSGAPSQMDLFDHKPKLKRPPR